MSQRMQCILTVEIEEVQGVVMSDCQERKRSREELEESAAELLLSLSCTRNKPAAAARAFIRRKAKAGEGIFECKTCSRRFPTFQALGGHRTSHKRAGRSTSSAGTGDDDAALSPKAPARSVHRCSICGVEFALGQALGGHMRRHMPADDLDHLKKRKHENSAAGAAPAVDQFQFHELIVVRRISSHPQLLQLFV